MAAMGATAAHCIQQQLGLKAQPTDSASPWGLASL